MAVTTINVGTPNGGNGDTLRDAFVKTNTNFDILSTTSKLASGDLTINAVRIGKGNNANFGSTAVGDLALNSNSATSDDNTAIGWSALSTNTSGEYNTAVGSNAMRFANASGNTAVGMTALKNSIGIDNTAVGINGLTNNSDGISNTGIGAYAMEKNTTGDGNTAVGSGALYNAVLRNNNTAVGFNALNGNTLFSNCGGFGAGAGVSADNQIKLGDTNVTTVVSTGTASFSDVRDKADIRDTVLGLNFVNSLRAVDYKWDYREDYKTEMPTPLGLYATEEEKEAHKIIMEEWLESCKFSNLVHDGSKKRTRYHHGLIAQEIQDVIEASGVDFGGFQDHTVGGGDEVMTVTYTELIAPMIKAIQELTARINVLEGN